MVVAILSAVVGCRGKEQPESAGGVTNSVSVKSSAEAKAGKKTTVRKSKTKLPAYLENTKDMPAGMAKSREVQREFVAEKLEQLQKQLMKDSEEVNRAENTARISDPKLGKLYKELIDKQIEYRSALDANEVYAAAKKSSIETLKQYQFMVERSKTLNKEKSNDK
jgi:hypothetical protein